MIRAYYRYLVLSYIEFRGGGRQLAVGMLVCQWRSGHRTSRGARSVLSINSRGEGIIMLDARVDVGCACSERRSGRVGVTVVSWSISRLLNSFRGISRDGIERPPYMLLLMMGNVSRGFGSVQRMGSCYKEQSDANGSRPNKGSRSRDEPHGQQAHAVSLSLSASTLASSDVVGSIRAHQ